MKPEMVTRNFTSIEIPKSLHREIKPYAVSVGKSVKTIVVEALTDFMEKVKKNPEHNLTREM